MYVTAVDDFVLSEFGIPPATVTNRSTRRGFGVQRREGVAGSMFVGNRAEPATWNVLFRCPDDAARSALLAALSGSFTEERRLLAQRFANDEDDLVVSDAALSTIEEHGALDLFVDFEAADSVWRALAATESAKAFASPLDHALRVAVPGNAPAALTVRVDPTAQRAAFAEHVGWRWRQRWRVTNHGDEPWFRFPVRLGLGNTAALVTAGKALASGNDLRVWLDGQEAARTLVGWNGAASFLWVVVPALPVGASIVFDVVYGNPAAGTPPALAYPDKPAFDLALSDNANWSYPTAKGLANAGLGLWAMTGGLASTGIVDFSVPGSWQPARTYDNPGNTDDVAQLRAQEYTDGGNVWQQAILSASRAAAGVGIPGIGTVNPFDGVAIHHPLGIAAVHWQYKLAMTYPGIVKLCLLIRDSAAEPWAIARSFNANADPSAPLAHDVGASGRKHVAIALWPGHDIPLENESGVVPETPAYGVAQLVGTTTRLQIPTAGLGIEQAEAETEVYEVALELRLGGGSELVPPYRALQVGNARALSGPGTPRAAVALDQVLVIDGEARTAEAWNAAATRRVEAVSANAVRAVVGRDDRGATAEFRTSEWLPVLPPRTLVPNGEFDTNVGSWSFHEATAGVTAAVAHDPGWGGAALGSLRIDVAANAAGAGATAHAQHGRFFSVNGRESVELAATAATDAAGLHPALRVEWLNAADEVVAASASPAWAADPAPGAAYRRVFAARVPAGATRYRVALAAVAADAGATGSVWFDDVTVNDNDLVVYQPAAGPVAVAARVGARWI